MRILFLLLLLLPWTAFSQASQIKPDQEIVFYPAFGHRGADGKSWELEIHGCVFEPERRRVALALLREALSLRHVRLTPSQDATFTERARFFMVDHERGKSIVVRLGERRFVLEKSHPNGHFAGVIRLSDSESPLLRTNTLAISAVLPANDSRRFTGELHLLEETGLTVISDIDDTIKLTGVQDRKTLLRNTFLEPYKPVPGMPEVYRAWAQGAGAQFCYVSASPWQLFSPLSQFGRSNGYPAGVFFLKDFRWKDQSFFGLFQRPEKYKPAIIEPLLQRFPNRRFVLVGDSGERDPEIYGALARRYPRQVSRILIRDLTGEPALAPRYQKAFRNLPPDRWKLFREPAEIVNAVPWLLD
ncbi:MAG TPA: phosphatase domain-containing protein [Bacillota bacterium]|nr:phosphatase domain-containing protein [Bacillota bacterium]